MRAFPIFDRIRFPSSSFEKRPYRESFSFVILSGVIPFPSALMAEAMGITGFTLATMYRWIASKDGRDRTLHAFVKGHYLGSGQAHMVLAEGELDGAGQLKTIVEYLG